MHLYPGLSAEMVSAPQPLLNKPMIPQAELPTSAQSGLCIHFRSGSQLFYFYFFYFLLLTDLSAFNPPWHLYGRIKIQKHLEAVFRCRQSFLSPHSCVETGHRGFHGSHNTVLSREGALGHTITSSLFIFLPLILSILSMLKKGVSLLLFHGWQDSGGNQALTPCGWAPL